MFKNAACPNGKCSGCFNDFCVILHQKYLYKTQIRLPQAVAVQFRRISQLGGATMPPCHQPIMHTNPIILLIKKFALPKVSI
jgi:hypothetical protein